MIKTYHLLHTKFKTSNLNINNNSNFAKIHLNQTNVVNKYIHGQIVYLQFSSSILYLSILKEFLGNKICNIKESKRIKFNIMKFGENKIQCKEFRVKFNMERMTLQPSLVFNWVMFLGGFSG